MKPYEKYKTTDIAWLGDIPSHWEVKKLTHIFRKIGSGTTPTAGVSIYYDDGEINWLQTGDLNDGIINETSKKISSRAMKDFSSLKIYSPNSLVVAMYGATIGKVGLLNIYSTTNQACCVLSDGNNLEIKYIFYFFQAFKEKIVSMAYGGGQPNISQDLIKSLRICFPPLSEQIAIANFLDKKTAQIKEAIALKSEQIIKLKEYRQTLINQTVTQGLNPTAPMKNSGVEWLGEIPSHWEVRRFRHLFSFRKGLAITKENLQDTGIPCVNYGEVHSKFGFSVNPEFDELKCVSEDYLKNNQKSLINYGDFVFADTSEDIEGSGNFTYLNSNKITFAGYHTIICTSKKNNHSRFLAYVFDSLAFRSQIRQKVKGVKVFSITQNVLKDNFVWLPPKDEQTAIADFLDKKTAKIDTAISQYQAEIDKLKEYQQSLVGEVVTGKVRVE